MWDFLQIVITGLTIGSIFAIVGLGFTAIYNSSGVINFAQGDFVMLGGFFGYLLLTLWHQPFSLGVVAALVILIVIGLVLQYGVVYPLSNRQASVVTIIIGTMAASMIFSGVVGSITGYDYLRVDSPLPIEALKIGELRILPHSVLILGVTIGMAVLYWFFLKTTIWGKALEAVRFSRKAASVLGIPITGMVALTFAISAAMGGVAGLLVAPLVTVDAKMGLPLVINGFIAAIVGGLGNPMGAVIGGFLVGIINIIVTRYLSSGYAMTLTFVVLLIILIFRPQGLLGERT